MDSKQVRMGRFLLARIYENLDGIFIKDLWEEICRESSFKDDNLIEQDLGPVLSDLVKDQLITGNTWYYKEEPRLVFMPVVHPALVDRSRFACGILGHVLPENCAFECQLALYVGGICTKCGKLVQGEFLGNCWTTEEKMGSATVLGGYDLTPAFKRGLRVRRIP